ncbi:MAG: L,D-transpeptidase family protein [bacterium]|jgi:L,D-transpeptidase YbiS
MKKVAIYISLSIFGLLLIVGAYLMVATKRSEEKLKNVLADSLQVRSLPEDERKAKKEIQEAKKSLARLKPAKPYIVIDTHANKVYLRNEDSILLAATASTGSGGEFIDSTTGRKWIFDTPLGIFKVSSKIPHPWWRKPDWAFLEEGEEIPKDQSERLDPNMMGDYALGFGDGYFIHGTIYERLLGINVTHGCVRVGSEDLEKLYNRTPIGTPIYIF